MTPAELYDSKERVAMMRKMDRHTLRPAYFSSVDGWIVPGRINLYRYAELVTKKRKEETKDRTFIGIFNEYLKTEAPLNPDRIKYAFCKAYDEVYGTDYLYQLKTYGYVLQLDC